MQLFPVVPNQAEFAPAEQLAMSGDVSGCNSTELASSG